MDGTDLTRALASKAAAVDYDELPGPVRALARQCVLDYYGVALAGATTMLVRSSSTKWPRRAARRRPASSATRRAFRCWRRRSSTARSAHALDYDDVNLAMPGHPSVAILPGLLGARRTAPQLRPRDHRRLCRRLRDRCRVGMAMRPGHYGRGFHATGTVGAFGAAAACARLLGSTPRRRRGRSASPGRRQPGSNRNSARCASRSTPARRRRTGSWRRGWRRAGFPAGPTSSNASRALPGPTAPISTRRRRSPAGAASISRQPLQVSRGLLHDPRADRVRPGPARAQGVRPDDIAGDHVVGRSRVEPDLQHPGADRRSAKPSSACARPWRWRSPGSIPRASAPTASRPPPIRRWSDCASGSKMDFPDDWPADGAEIAVDPARRPQGLGAPRRRHRCADIAARANGSPPNSTPWPSPLLGAARARELRETIAGLESIPDIGKLARLAAS